MSRRLCVVTMIDGLMTSGAEILATEIALSLDQHRFESILCSTRPSAPQHIERARYTGVEVLELQRRSKIDVWRWAPLFRLLRSGRVDVLHAHKIGSNLWASLFAPFTDVPVLIAHEHTWSYEGKALRKFADRELIARAASVFIAVSETDRRKMIDLERIPPEKVRFIPNGIPDLRAGNGARIRAELGIDPAALVVGTVCALRPQKAVDIAIDAVAQLVDTWPELRFVVVGDGPERDRLERHAARLQGRALFLGRRRNDEMPDVLAAMDVLVNSSRFEGTPLAVLEWMAAGRAIVATAVGGIPATLNDGSDALLVPPQDSAALATALRRLLSDPSERRRLGDAARARQQSEFRLERTVEMLQQLYLDLHQEAVRGFGTA